MHQPQDVSAMIAEAAYELVLLREEKTALQQRAQREPPQAATAAAAGIEPTAAYKAASQRLDEMARQRDALRRQAAEDEAALAQLQQEENELVASNLALMDQIEMLRNLAEDMEIEKSRKLAALVAPFECELCGGDEHPIDDAFLLPCCKRRVCREMMTGYAVTEIGEARVPVRCPFMNQQCAGVVEERDLVTLLDDAAYAQYRNIQFRKMQEMAGMTFCRAADCRGMVFREDLGQAGTASTSKDHFVCTVNEEHQWCLQCDAIWHTGSTCEKYQEWKRDNANGDAEVDRLVREMGWRRCPGCQNGVERIAGCNAMKCRCGAGFCYLCGYNAPGGDAHPHFNDAGPCHGKVWANQ